MSFNSEYDNFFMNMMNLLLVENKKVISVKGKKLLKKNMYDKKKFVDKVCPITLDKFIENEQILELPCNHIFKEKPIMKWLVEESNSCPVCRYKLLGTLKDNCKKILEEENKIILHETFLQSCIS